MPSNHIKLQIKKPFGLEDNDMSQNESAKSSQGKIETKDLHNQSSHSSHKEVTPTKKK